jgi:hypothetical protein
MPEFIKTVILNAFTFGVYGAYKNIKMMEEITKKYEDGTIFN